MANFCSFYFWRETNKQKKNKNKSRMRRTTVDDQWSHSSQIPWKTFFFHLLYPFHLRIDFQRESHCVCMKSYARSNKFLNLFCQTNKLTNRIIIPSFGIERIFFVHRKLFIQKQSTSPSLLSRYYVHTRDDRNEHLRKKDIPSSVNKEQSPTQHALTSNSCL